MTNSHGFVLEYPRIRVDHFDQARVPLPASLLAHRRSIAKDVADAGSNLDGLSFAPGQTHFDMPLLYLLTHIHTDHLKGLDRPGITVPIYCSTTTKQLLLKYERQKTRVEKDRDGTHTKNVGVVRPYAHLRVTDDHAATKAKLSGYQSTSVDLLHPLPFNVPTKVQYTPTSSVTLTLIESNHMVGGAMFLIQGAQGAVLHTGDMRAEEWWCEALTRNPSLSPYLCWGIQGDAAAQTDGVERQDWADNIESLGSNASSSRPADESLSQSYIDSQSQDHHIRHLSDGNRAHDLNPATKGKPWYRSQLRLRNIYLDTELLLCNQKVPTKQQACLDMVMLMRMYPPSTVFFLNCWTWGYEDMLIVTAKAFGCKIHVDRFKYIMYKAARTEAPFLADIITQDGSKTRFHACEKRNVCSTVQALALRYSTAADPALAREALAAHSQIDSSSPDTRQRWGPPRSQPEPLLVYVNPGQIAAEKWPSMLEDTRLRLEAAQRHETAWPEALVVPIERHSTLPELQMFVSLFRPKTVSPNTILDPKGGLDYYLLHHLFGHLLAGADDRRRMADEGLLLLGNQTWSFYEAQLARAREQAQAKRIGGGVGDSAEAVRAASASLNANVHAESVSGSLDAWQLERLSQLRGISFKGLMMQNMAGNLAAMLEIERWRRAAGIEEPTRGLDNVIEESLGSTQSKTDASVSSVGYDADHSQFAETQVVTREAGLSRNMHADEVAQSLSAPTVHAGACDESLKDNACASTPFAHDIAAEPEPRAAAASVSVLVEPSQHSQLSAAEGEDDEGSTALSEDLASRYLNVLIHYFNVSFHRTDASYVQMWKSVRRDMAEEAQKVEEHWFRETGVLPPLWSSQIVAYEPKLDSGAASDTTPDETTEEDKGSVLGDILSSFIDMLAPRSPIDEEGDLVAIPTSQDRTVALQLILRHFTKLGFHNPITAESSTGGQSHTSCPVRSLARGWRSMSAPLTCLTSRLISELQSLSPTFVNNIDPENVLLSLQITGVLFATPAISRVIDVDAVQALLESVIKLVEAAPRNFSMLGKGPRKLIALACAVLRAEELDEHVLAPFEQRLLALAQDSNGPLATMESLVEESASTVVSQSAPQDLAHQSFAAQQQTNEQAGGEYNFEESTDGEVSSMQIRPPRVASLPARRPSPHTRTTHTPEPAVETTDSIIVSATEHDTIESATSSTNGAPLELSQASSATQEEEETQSEQESQLGSLPMRRLARTTTMGGGGAARAVGRTTSLPTFLRDTTKLDGQRKRRFEEVGDAQSPRSRK
ncbi:hypothetical protein EX895_000835 [Sporisorium graminicola]|uniref:Metallo-beta-lactamase domain-containing protein n=1 Tax=Sporisorium graminicola TaxID=280036 RepID=A0A4U7L285_9BASI|nr:hypothetical protein EX895_000835 [Sporisorium graminicola]TKY90837.1 hypothetical protein EX895_000835 [Sporisorium graminicola]